MRQWLTSLTTLFVVLGQMTIARAQELDPFALDRFQPAPSGDRFFQLQSAFSLPDQQVSAMFLADYAYRPLVLYANDGDDRIGSVVSDHLLLHGAFSVAVWQRFVFSLDIPVLALSDGDSPSAGPLALESPSGAALGDVRLGARAALWGSPRRILQLALAGYVWLPTGDEQQFAGDGAVRAEPSLVLAGESERVTYAVNAGVTFRSEREFAAAELGHELRFGVGAALLALDRRLQIGPELYGGTTFRSAFERDGTNVEALLGAKFRVRSVSLGVATGPGLSKGLGTPALRAVLSVAYVPDPQPSKAPPDRDRDGVPDERDQCPDQPGDAAYRGCLPDRDRDLVVDAMDACPEVPGLPAERGCPADRDRDGVVDQSDACPDIPGVQSVDRGKHGCPPDRDGDGIVDTSDACPEQAGPSRDQPEKNGCPSDIDGDTIVDERDACPDQAGPSTPDPTANGCPVLLRVTEQEIVLLEQVQFKTGSDEILPESDKLLTEVATVLQAHPELTKIEVQGHTDNRGGAAFNRQLSQRRAESVVRWLTTRGRIDAARLTPKGYGMDRPIVANDSDQGRQKNRRVQFKIVGKESTGKGTSSAGDAAGAEGAKK